MRRYFEFIHDLRIFLIAFQVYSVSMFPSIVFISIDLCMDYVNRLYCNKWEKRKIYILNLLITLSTKSFNTGADHLLYDGLMGLLHHADAKGLQDTQRGCLV